MTHPVTELAAAAVIVCAAVGTMFAVQPQPKPEPPPTQAETTQEALKRCADNPERMCVVQVGPQPPRADEQRKIDQVAKDVRTVERDIQEIKAAIRIRQATEAAKALPQE